MMKMLRASRVQLPFGTQMPLWRVATGLGWVALGALAVGTTARSLSCDPGARPLVVGYGQGRAVAIF
jgi:hypothetical protein